MFPLDLTSHGHLLSLLIFGLIGVGFGVVLEMAGFGDARKLSGQFYFRDMTVLKVMFTGILTTALLLFAGAAFGYVDFAKIYVNQTYLWPGVVGGLIMGVGFVVGGYCPGTSIVSAASLKIDGLVFFGGTILGAGLFGESVASFGRFWNGSYTERLLVSDWLGWSVGATLVAITVVALALFYAAEKTEAWFASPRAPLAWWPRRRRYVGAAAAALGLALVVWGVGQPSPEEKWARMGGAYQAQLDDRDVFVHPLEFVKTWNDASIKLVTLDLRPRDAFEAFHLDSARHVTFDELAHKDVVAQLAQLPANGVVILVADDEAAAVAAWKRLKMEGVVNLYILDHGLRDWLDVFAGVADTPHFDLARPPAKVLERFPEGAYTPKIKLQTAHRAAGLCS
ncbi:MAG: YeeE/YedE family protein [Kofleriaceae bacterium]|nr:YeeE/YedE family protein [Myxococcales bacterium]MCB9565487.1 YeeE/YedE family protein [Kofleriaceae bacterium]MCB9570972.1 YeeE/YedE family protein [Kofleriaceae bacterium]